jgi:hypothetical protein
LREAAALPLFDLGKSLSVKDPDRFAAKTQVSTLTANARRFNP